MPNPNMEHIDASTAAGVAKGIRVFQTHRYDENDFEHVATLLEWLSPPPGARILDAGCGIGEVSRLMAELRPDLSFVLANLSAFQLSMAPTGERYQHILGDCVALPLPDESVDAAMFFSSLCQMDIPLALCEAGRVMRPGGTLLIVDMVRFSGHNGELDHRLGAMAHAPSTMARWANKAGLLSECTEYPEGDNSVFRSLFPDQDTYNRLFDGVHHAVMRFRKAGQCHST